MARYAVEHKAVAIRLACEAFRVSESCYRYESIQNAENEEIANRLLRLTDHHRNWGFGLCFLYLCNVKNFGWNHKRVYRIYRELELNLRVKPKRRLVRDKPEPLAVPAATRAVASLAAVETVLLTAAVPCVTTIGAKLLQGEFPNVIALSGVCDWNECHYACRNCAEWSRCKSRKTDGELRFPMAAMTCHAVSSLKWHRVVATDNFQKENCF